MSRICELCREEVEQLCNSHIIPEFMYKNCYNADHHFLGVFGDVSKKPTTHQIGIRQRLLCQKCENKFSKFESQVARILRDLREDTTPPLSVIERTNGDHRPIKLCGMSILWRCGIANQPLSREVRLGAYHKEKLRQLLHSDDPGDYKTYAMTLTKVVGSPALEMTILPPQQRRVNGMNAYHFFALGFYWQMTVSKHFAGFGDLEIWKQCVGYGSALRVVVLPTTDREAMQRLAARFQQE